MDPRDRADAMLARARARGRNIVTPDNMTSPMDASDTQQIPRTLVNAVDPRRDPDSTMILPSAQMGQQPARRPPHQAPGQPMSAQPMPAQSMSAQSMSAQSMSAQSMSAQSMSAQSMPAQSMPAQSMPVAAGAPDDAEITQVVQPGMIPTVSNHRQTRSSLSQRLSGDM